MTPIDVQVTWSKVRVKLLVFEILLSAQYLKLLLLDSNLNFTKRLPPLFYICNPFEFCNKGAFMFLKRCLFCKSNIHVPSTLFITMYEPKLYLEYDKGERFQIGALTCCLSIFVILVIVLNKFHFIFRFSKIYIYLSDNEMLVHVTFFCFR